MAPRSSGPFKSLKEFYPYYKQEHCKTGTRTLHFVGTSLFLLQAAAAGATRSPKLLLTGVLSAYSCAWLGHFFVEHNRCVSLPAELGGVSEAAAAICTARCQLRRTGFVSWQATSPTLPGPLLSSAVATQASHVQVPGVFPDERLHHVL